MYKGADILEISPFCTKEKWRIILLGHKVEKLERSLSARYYNVGYEIIDKYCEGDVSIFILFVRASSHSK